MYCSFYRGIHWLVIPSRRYFILRPEAKGAMPCNEPPLSATQHEREWRTLGDILTQDYQLIVRTRLGTLVRSCHGSAIAHNGAIFAGFWTLLAALMTRYGERKSAAVYATADGATSQYVMIQVALTQRGLADAKVIYVVPLPIKLLHAHELSDLEEELAPASYWYESIGNHIVVRGKRMRRKAETEAKRLLRSFIFSP